MGLKQGLILAVLLPLLAGCAWDIIDDHMEELQGQDIGRAMAKLGYPHSEITVGGRKHYVWHRREVGSYRMPRYETKHVSSYGSDGITFDSYSTTTYEQIPYDYECTLRIFVDDQERIVSWKVAGNQGACSTFAWRLSD